MSATAGLSAMASTRSVIPAQSPQVLQRLVIVLVPGLPAWQSLNITAFLASGLATARPDLIGAPYVDGCGIEHARLFSLPVVVLQADTRQLRAILLRASEGGMSSAVFVRGMLATNNDSDNRANVSPHETGKLDLLGIGLAGSKAKLGKILDGVPKHG